MAFGGEGFLTDVLKRAQQPIREVLGDFGQGDPLSANAPSWLGNIEKLSDPLSRPISPLFSGVDPLSANPFLGTLMGGARTPSPTELMMPGFGTPATPGGGMLARAIAQAQGKTQQPQAQSGQGPIARAIAGTQKPGGARTASTVPPASLDAAFAQAAEEFGVPLDYLKGVAATEDSAPDSISPAGARGLMQVVPGQGYDLPGEDWSDPATSIRQGARALRAKYDQSGDWDEAVRAYFGYGTDAGGVTTDEYANIFQQNLQRVREASQRGQPTQRPAPDGVEVPSPPPGVRPLRGITTAQYGSESLATGAADYICGPIAAQAFVRTQGREPTLQEALDVARGIGVIDPQNGMHGIDSTVQLIRKLGGSATTGAADTNRMAQEVMAGRAVIVNTRLHYFVAEGYDPTTGRFDFGNSAAALRSSGGRTQYTLDELANLTIGGESVGAPRGAIYGGY